MKKPNIYASMFEQAGIPSKKKTKKGFDFATLLDEDEKINASFQDLHSIDPDNTNEIVENRTSKNDEVNIESSPPLIEVTNAIENGAGIAKIVEDRPPLQLVPAVQHTIQQVQPLQHIQQTTNTETHTDTHIEINNTMDNETQGQCLDMRSDMSNKIKTETQNEPGFETPIETHSGTNTATHSSMHAETYTATLYSNITDESFLPFTPGQGKVLLYLIEANGRANRNVMQKKLGIPLGSIARTLTLLQKKGLIKRSESAYYEHRQRGFEYTIDNISCGKFIQQIINGGETHNDTYSEPYVETDIDTLNRRLSERLGDTHTDTHNEINLSSRARISSSVLKEIKPTTTKSILDDAELFFWRDIGLTEKQIKTWLTEFDMTEDELSLSLRYARFELLNRTDVPKPISWFYGAITKSGFFPRPQNYKSLKEIRAEEVLKQRRLDEMAVSTIDGAGDILKMLEEKEKT